MNPQQITEARKALKVLDEFLQSMETDNGRLKDTAPKSKRKDYHEIANAIAKNALRKAS